MYFSQIEAFGYYVIKIKKDKMRKSWNKVDGFDPNNREASKSFAQVWKTRQIICTRFNRGDACSIYTVEFVQKIEMVV